MTKEEVLEILEKEKAYMQAHGGDRQFMALDIAIKSLEQQPSEDCVSRTQALSAIRNLYPSAPFVRMNLNKWQEKNKKYFECEDIIKSLPPVTPTRKVGKWIKSEIGGAKVCSICQSHMGLSNFNYCPNCGAEMVGAENE